MTKLYADRIKKRDEQVELMIPGNSFRLRFDKQHIDLLKKDLNIVPPFETTLTDEHTDIAPVQTDQIEGTFTLVEAQQGDVLKGVFHFDIETGRTSDEDIEEFMEYSTVEDANHIKQASSDALTGITGEGLAGNQPITGGTDVNFIAGTNPNSQEGLKGMTWSIMDAKGANVMSDITGGATGKDRITLNFPRSGGDEVPEYTVRVTTASGETKEKKVLVGLGKDDLIQDKKTPLPHVKNVLIDEVSSKEKHSGNDVALSLITFKASTSKKGDSAKGNLSWIVYSGNSSASPILFGANKGETYSVDFSKLPEGNYRIEAYGQYSEWHFNNGIDRYGAPLKSKGTKSHFAQKDVVSKQNVLKGSSSTDFVTNKAKKQETNWGVPVKFTANMLFNTQGDIADLSWELKGADGKTVMKDVTDAAKGQASVVFNFPKPETATDYTLTLTYKGASKTQTFTVVPQAYVKSVTIQSDVGKNQFVYNERKSLKFKVTNYTQKKANDEDIKNTKWIRIFFPGLHQRDYKEKGIQLSFTGDIVSGATMGGKTTKQIEFFSGSDLWALGAGIDDPVNKENYQKGLYIVEAYTGKPDGRSNGEILDTVTYELIRNEPTQIVQKKSDGKTAEAVTLTDKGFMRLSVGAALGQEDFTFQVNSWLFGTSQGESANVQWALYLNDGKTLVKKMSEKGEKVNLHFAATGDYVLKAWVDDLSVAASLPVKIERAEITKMFIADSNGVEITTSGYSDKIHVYAETKGLEKESVQINLFELDVISGDDFLQSVDATVDASGRIFQEIALKKQRLIEEEGTSSAEVMPTLSFPKESKIFLSNKYIDRTYRNYYIERKKLLTPYNAGKATDYYFSDESGKVLTSVVLPGTKVLVHVHALNYYGMKSYVNIKEYNSTTGTISAPLSLPESKKEVVVNGESYAVLEFTVPADWGYSDPKKATDIRYFLPYIESTGMAVQMDVENNTDETRMLKVAKTMPSEAQLKAYSWNGKGPQQADLAKPEMASGPTLLYGAKVSVDFRKKVIDICGKLNANPDNLMAIMALETNGTFNPAIENSLGYVGLIQFGKDAATSVGTTPDELKKMTAVVQLDYVYKYLVKYKGKLNTLTDFYLAVLFPADVGKGNQPNYVVFDSSIQLDYDSKGNVIKNINYYRKYAYDANHIFQKETPESGKTYIWEIAKQVQQTFNKGEAYRIGVNDPNNMISPFDDVVATSEMSAERIDPVDGKTVSAHNGIDLVKSKRAETLGTPIRATQYGTIVFHDRSDGNGAGNRIHLTDINGYKHSFFHLLDGSITVKTGDTVKKGQIIGKIGTTGHSTGPHLHYEIRDPKGNILNPRNGNPTLSNVPTK